MSRKIIFTGEIDNTVAEYIIQHIEAFNDADAGKPISERDPIELIITSEGGCVSSGFAIVDTMEGSKTPIITHARGIVASMALGIFVAGNHRKTGRHTRFMYHSVNYGMDGTLLSHKRQILEVDKMQEMYDKLIIERSGLTLEELDEIKNSEKNHFFSALEAKKYGVVDEIVVRSKRG
ncbi:ATP-dependent Clp protease proteolytic subunit [Bacillus velezensis]|uniref:ClpP family protease n=1 Tax=Bacillus velezensis TaxID=492670 RepID=UPI0018C6A663|nr:ATP-dependent Clp protease proteolytic subunit [Bacillus velezensis]QPK89702.1 ATP-dependent Clp protease proteolytic subunit [Bacillus velezensis]